MQSAVRVLIRNPLLRDAVSMTLTEALACRLVGDGEPADLVVTTTRDATGTECRRNARNGTAVVALAALPSYAEREMYDGPGVTYVSMGANREVIRKLLEEAARSASGL